MIKAAVDNFSGKEPSKAKIWKSMQERDITMKIRDLLWKATHGGYWLGNKWNHIPNYKTRATCQCCQMKDSMEHILTDCKAIECKTIWKLVQDLWRTKIDKGYKPTLGLILGAPVIAIRDDDGKILPGATRLYRILMTESAHAIWALRCQRVIEHENDQAKAMTELKVKHYWTTIIQARLDQDRAQTNIHKFGSRAILDDKVLQTWSGTSRDEDNLPPNWV